jgi:nicotinamidase-related amidase
VLSSAAEGLTTAAKGEEVSDSERSGAKYGDPGSTAVLCVECQNGVIGEHSVLPNLASDSAGLVENIGKLLDGARSAGVRVVHATFEGVAAGTDPGSARIWRALGPATAHWTPECEGVQVVPRLNGPGDLVIPRHHGLFPTSGTELLPVLRGLGVQTVVLTGVSLNLALPHTAGDIVQQGLDLVVPRDAVAGTPAEYGEQVLANTMVNMGRLTTVDKLLAYWSEAEAASA